MTLTEPQENFGCYRKVEAVMQTVWAESGISLQVRASHAAKSEADVQATSKPGIVLQCRKSAWSPNCVMLRAARMSASMNLAEDVTKLKPVLPRACGTRFQCNFSYPSRFYKSDRITTTTLRLTQPKGEVVAIDQCLHRAGVPSYIRQYGPADPLTPDEAKSAAMFAKF